MSAAITGISADESVPPLGTEVPKSVKAWPAVAMVAAYWTAYGVIGQLDIADFNIFLFRTLALLILLLAFLGWWLFQRGASRRERWGVLGATIALGVAAMLLRHKSIVIPAVVMPVLQAVFTAWAGWLWFVQAKPARLRRTGMIAIAAIAWAATLLVRMDGLSGETKAVFHLRWTPSAEEQYLVERAKAGAVDEAPEPPSPSAEPLVAKEGDWPTFRGGELDATVSGIKIATDWNEHPPKQLWRRRMGPGWSSITVVDDRLFTQEQRGEIEAVVCFDAATGDVIWSHEDKARFSETLGGDGPRATPTFHEGMIYALGATGILNCLDGATGEVKWTRNIAEDSGAKTPDWGFTSSPLIIDGRVIVFSGGNLETGGDPEKSLLAYDATTGASQWQASGGSHSYSSPQRASLDGVEQVLFLGDASLNAVDPADGTSLWQFAIGSQMGQPSIQPHPISPSQLLVSFTPDGGTILLDVKRDGEKWQAEPAWIKKTLKPFFNDFVRHEDALYGFDRTIFCSVDLKTGKLNWKGGRYGAGQVLLLADQGVLLVITEKGEAVLVEADPNEHHELGKFQAIEGKTWNHPTLVSGRLFVRNAEEMACYELKIE